MKMFKKQNSSCDNKILWRKIGNIALGIFVFFAVLITFFVVQFNLRYDPYTVHGTSMQPTLNMYGGERNDIVYVCKNRTPKRGDIGVFQSDEIKENGQNVNLIKRVIAIGGDEINIVKENVEVEVLTKNIETGEFIKTIRNETQYNIKLKVKGSKEFITLKENYVQDGVLNEQKYLRFKEFKANPPYFLKEDEALLIPEGCYFVLGDNRANSEDSAMHGAFSKCLGRVDYVLHYNPLKGTAENGWAVFGFMFNLKF